MASRAAPSDRVVLAVLAALIALAGPTPAAAQSHAAWFGVPVPTGLALPPSLSVLDDPDFTAPHAAVPAGEERFVDLDGEKVAILLEQIVEYSRRSHANGERMWGRISGLPLMENTARWVAGELQQAGLTGVHVQPYRGDAAMWWPDEWEVRLLGLPRLPRGSTDVVLHSAVPTRGARVPDGMATANLVYAGDIGAFRDVDVRGAVAVQRAQPGSGPYGASAFSLRSAIRDGAEELMQRGAVAVLNYIDQPGNMHVRDFAGCSVCFNIGGEDGAFLRDVYERALRDGQARRLRARLSLQARERPLPVSYNVFGVVPGDSDEVIIVNAHMDGWYDAAGDNGDGLAVQVALARHFARPENRPARTLVFVASGGHHSPGLNGPEHFVERNPELARRAVLVLNLEHVAQYEVDPGTWRVERTEQPMGWGVTNLAPFLLQLTDRGVERYGFRLRPEYGSSVPGDLGRYEVLGVPRVQAIHAGPLYHTSADVLQSISVEGLERAARFYAFFIDGVARATREQIDP